jgi:tRNA(adenine34) deaminase
MSLSESEFSDALTARLADLMRAAIAEARRADDPFGCAWADAQTGELLGAAANSAASDPTGHAEVNALRLIAERGFDPTRVALISTAEPCPMCASASWWAKVRGVVWGTSIASLIRFGWDQIDLPMPDLMTRTRPPSTLILKSGFLAEETDPLYQEGPRRR